MLPGKVLTSWNLRKWNLQWLSKLRENVFQYHIIIIQLWCVCRHVRNSITTTNTIRLVCRTDNFLEKIIFLFQLKNSKKLLFCQNTMNIIGCLIFHLIYLRVVVMLGASNLYANKPNQKNGSNDENKHNFEIFVLNQKRAWAAQRVYETISR